MVFGSEGRPEGAVLAPKGYWFCDPRLLLHPGRPYRPAAVHKRLRIGAVAVVSSTPGDTNPRGLDL